MNKSLLLLLIVVISAFSSCRKDGSVFEEPNQKAGVNSGGASDSYYPVSTGSVRTYKSTTQGVSSTMTETITGKTVTFDNEKYYEASTVTTNVSGAKSTTISHIYGKDGVYRSRTHVPTHNLVLEFEYLRANTAVGGTWIKNVTSSGTINSMPARIKCTMKGKGISKVVNGKTYKDVIHVTMELQYDMFGSGFETSATYEFYNAKGIGHVLVESTIDSFGIKLTSITELLSHSIK